ncbi:MAG: hypothetical protein ACFFD4_08155 [Candidatus Odinarchaeota archaeon]
MTENNDKKKERKALHNVTAKWTFQIKDIDDVAKEGSETGDDQLGEMTSSWTNDPDTSEIREKLEREREEK